MKNVLNSTNTLLISVILSWSILFAGTSAIRYFDPTFSIDLLDLLSQFNITAWLLMALLAGMIYNVLSSLSAPATGEPPEKRKTIGKGQISD